MLEKTELHVSILGFGGAEIGYSGDDQAALYAVQCGAFDTLQTSLNLADQQPTTLTLLLAHADNMGVICKRPIANAAWKYTEAPGGYPQTYWERLHRLQYDFLADPQQLADLQQAASIALRFTLSQPGVQTAIVGTTHPDRWHQNAALLGDGPLPAKQIAAIRARWQEAGGAEWPGQQ